MDKETVKKISEIDDAIEYWEKQRRHRLSGLGEGQLIFCDEYAKVDGHYDRIHIPVKIAYKIVYDALDKYIDDLKKERKSIEEGKKTLLKIIKGYIQ